MYNNRQKGNIGEDMAAEALEKKGYTILKRNYRVKSAEIDIIAKKDDTVVFVEVKLRKNTKSGFPSEAVNKSKQNKIIAAALNFIGEKELSNCNFRFDVFDILLVNGNWSVNHIENAFIIES